MSKSEDTSTLPKISIIMPSFNSVDYIERSIRSVVEQDYPYLELIIKDGGSEDGSLEIIKHYALKYPKIIKWMSSKDKGQTDAINQGMAKATGEVLTFLNADDVYKRNSLKIVGKYFGEHLDVMWAYGKGDIIDTNDRVIRRSITAYKNFWMWHYSYTTLLILNYISQMCCFWRKEAREKVGKFDDSQFYVMDYEYWLKLGKHFKAGVIYKYLGSFRIVSNSKSSKGFITQFKDEYKVVEKYTANGLILLLHRAHYLLIILVYTIIRFVNKFKHSEKFEDVG